MKLNSILLMLKSLHLKNLLLYAKVEYACLSTSDVFFFNQTQGPPALQHKFHVKLGTQKCLILHYLFRGSEPSSSPIYWNTQVANSAAHFHLALLIEQFSPSLRKPVRKSSLPFNTEGFQQPQQKGQSQLIFFVMGKRLTRALFLFLISVNSAN